MSGSRELASVRRAGWTSRGVALTVAVLLHVAFAVGFLSKFRLGIPVFSSTDAYLSEAPIAIVASIASFGIRDSVTPSMGVKPLDARALASPAARIDVPVTSPSFSSEDETEPATARPAAISGSTGLHCEVHIHQSPRGRVQAIDFGECTGDFVWQRTLLQTIERAAQQIEPRPDTWFPPVRTLSVSTDNLSESLLARQLSNVEALEQGPDSKTDEGSSQLLGR